MNWRIFYDDRESCTGDDSEESIATAPTRGVQVIVQDHPRDGVEFVTKGDYYVWKHDRWWGVDYFGLWDYLCSDGMKKVLCGRTLEQDSYNKIVKKANVVKTAWAKGERRPSE